MAAAPVVMAAMEPAHKAFTSKKSSIWPVVGHWVMLSVVSLMVSLDVFRSVKRFIPE